MMRKGPLERHPVDSVLRAAAAEAFTGAIVITANAGGTVLFDGGLVIAASLDDVGVPAAFGPASEPTGEELQANIREVVATLLDTGAGSYQSHELHPSIYRLSVKHRTRYPVETLLADVAALPERTTLEEWSGAVLEAGRGARRTDVTLDADMWRLLVAMTEPTTIHRLASRLPWDAARTAETLRRLEVRRLIRPRRLEHESAASITDEIDQLWPSTRHVPQTADDEGTVPSEEAAPADDVVDEVRTEPRTPARPPWRQLRHG